MKFCPLRLACRHFKTLSPSPKSNLFSINSAANCLFSENHISVFSPPSDVCLKLISLEIELFNFSKSLTETIDTVRLPSSSNRAVKISESIELKKFPRQKRRKVRAKRRKIESKVFRSKYRYFSP